MADTSTGAIGGFLDAQASQDTHALRMMQVAEGKSSIELNELELKKGNLMLQQQEKYVQLMQKRLHDLSQVNGSPSTPAQNQAWQSSQILHDMAMDAVDAQLPGEAALRLADSAKLAENATLIDLHEAELAIKKAGFTSAQMDWVLKAKTDEEAQQRWAAAQTGFQEVFKEKSRYAGVPFDRTRAEELRSQAITAANEALIKQRNAQEDHARSQIETDKVARALKAEQLKLTQDKRDYLNKHGGLTPAQEAKAQDALDARELALNDIGRLRELIEKDPNVVGLTGTIKEGMEFARTKSGYGDQEIPATEFDDTLTSLKTALPNALGAKNTRLKIVQQHIEDLSNLRSRGKSGKQALDMLRNIEDALKTGKDKERGEKKATKKYKSIDEVRQAVKDGMDYDEAAAILHEQFGVEE
jgi:hypothetical protein